MVLLYGFLWIMSSNPVGCLEATRKIYVERKIVLNIKRKRRVNPLEPCFRRRPGQ